MKMSKIFVIAATMITAIGTATVSSNAQLDNPFERFVSQLPLLSNEYYLLRKKGKDFDAPEMVKIRNQAIGLQNLILSQGPDPLTISRAIYGGIEIDLMDWDRLIAQKLISNDFIAKWSTALSIEKQLSTRNIEHDDGPLFPPSVYHLAGMDDDGTLKNVLMYSAIPEITPNVRAVTITTLVSLEYHEKLPPRQPMYFNSNTATLKIDIFFIRESNRWVINDIRFGAQSKTEKQQLVEYIQKGSAALKRGRR